MSPDIASERSGPPLATAGPEEYVLNGAKRWIGNASFADVTVIWARDEQGDVGGYLVPRGSPGSTHRR